MVNKVILLGNLAADPERRTTPQGTAVVNVRLATNEKFKDREGVLQERSEFHRIVFWGRQAETIDRYARKGRPLFVEGRIQTREYQDRDGNRRWATEIVARDFRFIAGARGDESRSGGWSENREKPSWGDRQENDRGDASTERQGWGPPEGSAGAEPPAPASGESQSGATTGGSSSKPVDEPFSDEWGGPGSDEDLPFWTGASVRIPSL